MAGHDDAALCDLALIERCRVAAEAATERAAAHRVAYVENERSARDLFDQLRELEDAHLARRTAVLRRWRSRQQLREARALLANAAPMPVAGRAQGVRTFARYRAEELINQWWKKAAPLPSGCGESGVYALFHGYELVYIGQAVNVAARIGQHFDSKQFTHASYVSVPRDQLNAVERLLLDVFTPRLNRDCTTNAMRRALGRTPG